jgi:hypothetical protein
MLETSVNEHKEPDCDSKMYPQSIQIFLLNDNLKHSFRNIRNRQCRFQCADKTRTLVHLGTNYKPEVYKTKT